MAAGAGQILLSGSLRNQQRDVPNQGITVLADTARGCAP